MTDCKVFNIGGKMLASDRKQLLEIIDFCEGHSYDFEFQYQGRPGIWEIEVLDYSSPYNKGFYFRKAGLTNFYDLYESLVQAHEHFHGTRECG